MNQDFYDRSDPYMDKALGLISVQSFPAIVGIADMMLKGSAVMLVGYEQIGGGYCTAVVRGGISDVRMAITTGEEVAAQFGQKVSSLVMARPMPDLDRILPIGSKLAKLLDGREYNRFRDQAVGLVETIGFPAMVAAADAMVKSADVTLSAYEKIGSGLCTAIVRGSVANVAAAIESGMAEAERVGELHAVMLIPRPLDDLERSLPLASCWMEEELKPLRMPIDVREAERQPLPPLELPVVLEGSQSFEPRTAPQKMQTEAIPVEVETLNADAPPLRLETPPTIDPDDPEK
jgi:carbon dioxide concentrating mechanism protein CcmO